MGDAPHYTFVADRGFADRLARARYRDTQFGVVTFSVVLIVLMAALGIFEPVFLTGAAVFAALTAVLQVVVFRELRRAAKGSAPEGDVTQARYDDIVLRVADDDTDVFLPYALLREVRPRGRFVVLRRVDGRRILLPVELCPAPEQDRIRQGIAAGVLPQIDPAQFPHVATVDAGFVRAATHRVLALLVRTPSLVAIGAGVLVAGAVVSAAFSDPVPVVVAVLMLALWPVLIVANTRSSIRKQVGAERILSGFDDERMTVSRGSEVTRMRYSFFDRFVVSRGAVELRVAATREWHLYPLGSFPPEVRDRIRSAVADRAGVAHPVH